MALQTIMVVSDPALGRQPGFDRALDLARVVGAHLHLYACIDGDTSGPRPQQSADAQQLQLEGMAARARQEGIAVEVEIETAPDWYTRVLRAAARCGADLVVKYSFDHSDLQRELRKTSDWTLLRNAPCPVLMIKNYHSWRGAPIVAAINVNSRDGSHTRLNNQIIRYAGRLGGAFDSEVHFVNAWSGTNHLPPVDELAERCGVVADRVHIAEGAAEEVILEQAEALAAELIIIGTVGRSGLSGKLLGNTAEKLLDHTHLDVLVLN